MQFYIQTSSPLTNDNFDSEDESTWEAIESIFSMDGEYAFIVWDQVFIPVSFKYDLGIMMPDILVLLNTIQNNKFGKISIQWPSDTFNAVWNISWNSETIILSSRWIFLRGELHKHLLSRPNKIMIKKNEFMWEWKMVLEIIKNNLVKNGYDSEQLKDFSLLEKVYNRIDNYGILYR